MSLNKIYRHEETYVIGLKEYYRICCLARKFLPVEKRKDPADSHVVRSLYFDTMNGQIHGKRSGDAIVRLRVRDSLKSQADLEFSAETDGGLRREQLPVAREDALKIISGDFSPLEANDSDLVLQIHAFLTMETYRPDVMIEYSHIGYEFPAYQARIVFKANVCAGYDSMKFFDSGACGIPVLPEDTVILKAEYNFDIPPFLRSWIDFANGEKLESSEYEYLCGRLKPAATISTGD